MSSAVFDFADINRRMNRKPAPAALVSPSEINDQARQAMNFKPAFYTCEEGGEWKPWSQNDVGDLVHSIAYETGEVWDETNGMRKQRVSVDEIRRALVATGKLPLPVPGMHDMMTGRLYLAPESDPA